MNDVTYLIAHTPRTGSNWLCEVLHHTGVAGNIHPDRAGLFVGYGPGLAAPGIYPDKVNEYFADSRGENGVAGMKSDWGYLDTLEAYFPTGAVDEIMGRFTHFIYLYREDVVAQAVSWRIAATSGVFTSVNRGKPDKGNPFEVEYDREDITRRIDRIGVASMRWMNYFAEQKISPLSISTESLRAKGGMSKAVREIFKHLDVSAPRSFKTQLELERMVNPLKVEYVERYNAGE